MDLVVIDTDVAPSMLRRRTPESILRQLHGRILAASFVTVGELTKWTLLRSRGPSRTASMDVFLDQLVVLPYDSQVAKIFLARGLPLATATVKDFTDFTDFTEHEGLGRRRPRPASSNGCAACCVAGRQRPRGRRLLNGTPAPVAAGAQ